MPSYQIYAHIDDFAIHASGATWAGAQAGQNAIAETAPENERFVDARQFNGNYFIAQWLLHFDTSQIPAGETVSSASLSVRCNLFAGVGVAASVSEKTWSTPSTVNYTSGPTDLAALINFTDPASPVRINSVGRKTLPKASTSVPRSATYGLVVFEERQRSNTAPVGENDQVNLRGADSAGTTDDPYLSITTATVHLITAADIATKAAVISAGTIGQAHNLSASNVATGVASITAPTLTQAHGLVAANIATASAAISGAALAQEQAITAAGVTTGPASISASTVTHLGDLETLPIATGAAQITAGGIVQAHNLVPLNLATGAAVLSPVAIVQAHAISAASIATAAPSISAATLLQLHALAAQNVATAAAVVALASIFENIRALDIATGGAFVSEGILVPIRIPPDRVLALIGGLAENRRIALGSSGSATIGVG